MTKQTRIGKTDLHVNPIGLGTNAHVVLAWYLTRGPIDVVIPGANRADQVLNILKL